VIPKRQYGSKYPMYPDGYPRENAQTCRNHDPYLDATCIIDNIHSGRKHWGPDQQGVFHEWARVSVWSSLASSLGLPSSSVRG
jgi:hypothetical protein